MRFLHTADWHIGKIVNDYSMIDYQQEVLNQIIGYLNQENYDALIIAGDLYDRAQPSAQSIELVNNTFKEILLKTQTPILLISGNHDSQTLIEYGSFLFEKNNFYSEGLMKSNIKKITIGDTDFYLFPFVTPQQANYHYQSEFTSYDELWEHEINKIEFNNKYNVLIAHGYLVKDGMVIEKEDSVRPLSVGTTEYVDVKHVSRFDYVALGHLHGSYPIGYDHIQYSGSILRYSKSEVNHQLSVNDVTLDNTGVHLKRLPLNPSRNLIIKEGYFEDLIKEFSQDFVFYELLDTTLVIDAMSRLKQVAPFAMGLNYKNIEMNVVTGRLDKAQLSTQEPLDLFKTFYQQSKESALTQEQELLVTDLFKEVNHETN